MLRPRTRTSALAVAVAAASALVATAAATAAGATQDPSGNNGTVKVAPDGELDAIPQNHPHQGCTFQLEWYGFDEGDDVVSTVDFEMQAPTSDVVLGGDEPSKVPVGGDSATGAGTETGPDGVQTYTLSFDGAPHPVQGYHVKLTVTTPGSAGSDVKHKVFWVTGCDSTAPEEAGESTSTAPTAATQTTEVTGTTATTTSTTEPGGESGTTITAEPGDEGSTAGSQATQTAAPVPDASTSTSDDTEVRGEQAVQDGADVPSVVDAGERGPVAQLAGSGTGLLVAGVGALVALGALLVRRRRV